MSLDKLIITNLDNEQEFTVLFNPTEYTIEDSSQWQEQQGKQPKPELQYTGGARKKLSMELFFDTYEANEDVRKHTREFAKLLVVSINDKNHGKRPPKVRLRWGPADPDTGFPFVGVLESLRQQFTLFNHTGMPVRAKLSVTFKEFSLPKEELRRNPRRNSFPAQMYTVKAGDTLSGIAGAVWQDPLKWRRIATANDIDNPQRLQPGQELVVPAIE